MARSLETSRLNKYPFPTIFMRGPKPQDFPASSSLKTGRSIVLVSTIDRDKKLSHANENSFGFSPKIILESGGGGGGGVASLVGNKSIYILNE